MTRNGEPAVKPLKLRSIAILGLLLVILGALSLYQGIAEKALLWLPWVRGLLAVASGLGLVVLSLNRSRCTQGFMRQAIIPRLSRDLTRGLRWRSLRRNACRNHQCRGQGRLKPGNAAVAFDGERGCGN
jgi:hypothetical protein